jgi:menaquinone-specific isochorismate synthase
MQLGDGRLVRGSGPFDRRRTAPDDGWAFFVDDFFLSEPSPWLIPSRVEVLGPREEPEEELVRHRPLRWQPPDAEAFRKIFDDVMGRMQRGELRKAVPAVAEHTVWVESEWREFLAELGPGPGGSVFGCQLGALGFAGRTPEILFRLRGNRLHTMALAGTAPAGSMHVLLENRKLLREHELVVEVLRERLSALGDVTIGPRHTLPLGRMAHLCTEVDAVLDDPSWVHRGEELIRLLHPTPALGIAPRTPETLALLHRFRDAMNIPRHFGAPLGIKHPGGLEVLVAIRGVFWENGAASLPAGCGLVEGSECETEWAELELKRRCVRQALGLNL